MLLLVAPEVPTPVGAGSPPVPPPELVTRSIMALNAAICGPDFFA